MKWPKCEGSGWFIQDIQLNDWTREGRCVSRTTGCPRGLRARNSHWGGVQCVNDKGNLVCPKGMFVSNKYVEKSCESNEYIPYR